MIEEGQIVLLRFPYADAGGLTKVRPGAIVRKLPGDYDDWLVCMVSSQLDQAIEGLDETLAETDDDFLATGLKAPSVIRVSRVAVCHGSSLLGAIGRLSGTRLDRIRDSLAGWISVAKQ